MTIKKVIYIQIIKEIIFYTALYAIMASMTLKDILLDLIPSVIPLLIPYYFIEVGGSVLLIYLFYLLLNRIYKGGSRTYRISFIFGVIIIDLLIFHLIFSDQRLNIGYYLFRILYTLSILPFFYRIPKI